MLLWREHFSQKVLKTPNWVIVYPSFFQAKSLLVFCLIQNIKYTEGTTFVAAEVNLKLCADSRSSGLHCDQIVIQRVLCTQIRLVLESGCPHLPSLRDCNSTSPVFHNIAFAFKNTLQTGHKPAFKVFRHILRTRQVNEAVYERSVIASSIVCNLRLCFRLRVGTLM